MPAPHRNPSPIVRTVVLLTTLLAASLTPLLLPAASDAATSTASSTTSSGLPATTSPPRTTTTSGGIGSCEQYPPMATFVSATSSSLTFAVTWSGPNCGYGGGGRLTLNTSKSFDGAIVVAISPGNNVTVPNLTPNTAYYWGTQGSSPVSSGWQGPASTLPYVSPTTTTIVCDPMPPSISFVSATATSLTFSYRAFGTASCGGQGLVYVRVSPDATQANSVSVTAAWPSGTVTVPNLRPGTAYSYTATGGGSPFGNSWFGPVSTLTAPTTTTTTVTACDPFPPKVSFASATSTSLTFSYQAYGTASCGGQGAVTIRVSPDKTFENSVTVTAPWPSGTATVPNLTPGTAYWYYATGGGSPFGGTWAGPASTLPTVTTTTRITCDPLPPALTFVSATSSSLTFSYRSNGGACGDTASVVVHVRLPGASADTATLTVPAPSGTVTVTGLAAGTSYSYGASGGGSPFGTSWYGTATTLGGPTTSTSDGGNGCSATYTALSAWPGNFLANLVVTNVSPVPFTGWRVTWTWPNGQTLVAAYSATAGGSGADPVVTNAAWGGRIQAGGKAETVLMNAGTPPASAPVLTCTVLD